MYLLPQTHASSFWSVTPMHRQASLSTNIVQSRLLETAASVKQGFFVYFVAKSVVLKKTKSGPKPAVSFHFYKKL